MAVRRKGSMFGGSGYGTAPPMPRPSAPQMPPQGAGGPQGGEQQGSPMPPQQMQSPPQSQSAGGPMTPMNIDPFLTPGGPMEDQVDPLTILSLLQSKGML